MCGLNTPCTTTVTWVYNGSINLQWNGSTIEDMCPVPCTMNYLGGRGKDMTDRSSDRSVKNN